MEVEFLDFLIFLTRPKGRERVRRYTRNGNLKAVPKDQQCLFMVAQGREVFFAMSC